MSFATAARLVALVALIVAAATCGCANAQSRSGACGPFGNLPVKILGAVKPACGGGRILGPWKDGDSTDRYACLYDFATLKPGHKLPLLVYLHPSLFGPWTITHTNLLDLRTTSSLGADPAGSGYIVLAPQGRNTAHYYQWPDNSGMGWDNWYRQLSPSGEVTVGGATYRENVDAAAIDHFIHDEVLRPVRSIPARIYLSGWSDGAAMALLYALNRQAIAAAAVYSAPDPFGAFNDPCPQTPVPRAPTSNWRRYRSSIRASRSCTCATVATSAASAPTPKSWWRSCAPPPEARSRT